MFDHDAETKKVSMTEDLNIRIQKIKLVIVDNDGVLTDGRIIFGDYGDELKLFDVQDGFGLILLRRAGLTTVMISGKKSRINRRRGKEIQINKVYQNVFDKREAFERVLKKFKVRPEEICCIGDDLIDLPILRRVGLACAVSNAVEEVRTAAHYVTSRHGGRGAVREVADMILKT
ncbi:MAG: HAD hydrolase family protein, partial [Candidatus Omnitrophota bacterium]